MNLKIKISNKTFQNPIWVASGTFGASGEEFADFINFNQLGALITKTVTLKPKEGNPAPRLFETASGLLNSIGLPNPGAEVFKKENYARLKNLPTDVVVSIAGNNPEEFVACTKILAEKNFPAALELNLSCPNVCHGKARYHLIAQDAVATAAVVSAVRQVTALPLIVKLTPNVTDIVEIAKAAESAGADALALANAYRGMAVDAATHKPLLGNIIGGLSGPAIKPLALLAVFEVAQQVKIPIIGIGGIMTGEDVVEFMLCGASAVQIGTANLINPNAQTKIFTEFKNYLQEKGIQSLAELVGKLQT